MPGGAYIDEHGVVHSRSELARMDGREMLLREQASRAAAAPTPGRLDIEAGGGATGAVADGGGGFRFHGFAGFKWRSMVGAIVAGQFLMYFVSMWVITPRAMLTPSGTAMYKIGSSNSVAEMCAFRDEFPHHLIELRRWLVPIFLHANPMHILLNVYFECTSGPRIEEQDSPLVFALLFFGSGLLGNLLSDAFGVNGVGGSTSCYGIIGMEIAIWAQKWPELEPEMRESVKAGLMQRAGMLLLWEVMLWKEIDHFGHLGGFLGGFLIVMGRVDRRYLLGFSLVVAGCIWSICIQPLFKEDVNGYPWRQACASAWEAYNQ